MAEYIEREAVEKMFENASIISNGEYSEYCTEDIYLNDIPAADVAPVILCKYCKHYHAVIIGAQVEFDYADDIWHGLRKTVVFKGAVTKDVVTDANIVTAVC